MKKVRKTTTPPQARYPKPGKWGGTLIRRAIALLRQAGVALPLSDSHILIAVSGGPDSVALGALLLKYGRRIAPRGAISLLHFNHGWRPEGAREDELHVRMLAKKWKVPVEVIELPAPATGYGAGESWEAKARELRQAVYKEKAAQGARILTAHQADDLAETVLWRLLTAGGATALGGIGATSGPELRPLLTTRKAELRSFLKEEGLDARDDPSNRDERFLRARLRARVMPELESIFPRAIERLTELALAVQGAEKDPGWTELGSVPSLLLRGLGARVRSPHHERLKRWVDSGFCPGNQGDRELQLGRGWSLKMAKRRLILERSE